MLALFYTVDLIFSPAHIINCKIFRTESKTFPKLASTCLFPLLCCSAGHFMLCYHVLSPSTAWSALLSAYRSFYLNTPTSFNAQL